MGFWQLLAIQQTFEGVVFALLAVAGIRSGADDSFYR